MENWHEYIGLIQPTVYFIMIIYLVWETRRNGRNDKFPCIIVKGRHRTQYQIERENLKKWGIRLINVGRGPAFIYYFNVAGLTERQGSPGPQGPPGEPGSPVNGNRIHDIDKVIGPEVGDQNLQMEFAEEEEILILQRENCTIIVKYRDILGREFTSGIRNGDPIWEAPNDFKYGLLKRCWNWIYPLNN